MAGIGMVDIETIKEYLTAQGISFEIYSYESNPSEGLLVLNQGISQKEIFDKLVTEQDALKGGFWSHSTVSANSKLTKVL